MMPELKAELDGGISCRPNLHLLATNESRRPCITVFVQDLVQRIQWQKLFVEL